MEKITVISITDPEFDVNTKGTRDFVDIGFWKLYGKLAELFDNDKAYLTGDLLDSLFWRSFGGEYDVLHLEGIYEVEVMRVPERAVGYFWVEYLSSERWIQHGLVTLESDMQARKEALIIYNNGKMGSCSNLGGSPV